jgi:microcystin-dependent protein
LFSILGTTYGGNGTVNFGLPDLRGRAPVSQGQGPGLSNYNLGQLGGTETITLTTSQMPAHNHAIAVSNNPGTSSSPIGSVFFGQGPATGSGPNASNLKTYTSTNSNLTALNAASMNSAGGGMPHSVLSPYLAGTWLIALEGIFPSRN